MNLPSLRSRLLLRLQSLSCRIAGALCALAVGLLPLRADAAAGDPDATFNGSTNDRVIGMAVQPDGKVLVGGNFTTAGGVARTRLARFNADGTIDAGFNQTADGLVIAIAVQPDGKILVGGQFSFIGGVSRQRIARLNADGTLDTAFDPSPNNLGVYCINLLPDGKIFVSGTFDFIAGNPSFAGIARLNADGTFDHTWGISTNAAVFATVIQPDGKLLLTGTFTSVNGESHNGVVRLNADGTTDSSFNASSNPTVLATTVQTDGKVLIAGSFTSTGNDISRARLARFNVDGSLDASFIPVTNGRVWGLSLQTDGKILAVGDFFAVGTNNVQRNHIARFNVDGTLDTTFDPNVDGDIMAANFQADGKILIGGLFNNVGTGAAPAHTNVARILNVTATQALTVPSVSRIQWLRGGASVEVQQVTFELSTDGGTTYGAPVSGKRLSSGWEATGLNLPTSGRIRARARVQGGAYNGGNSLQEVFVNYGPLPTAPEIAVEQPSGTGLTSGGSKSLPPAVIGTNSDSVFVIRNSGGSALTLTGTPRVTVSGANAGLFTVTAQPAASVSAAGSANFTVRFSPDSTGVKSATLSIAHNDFTGTENPFVVNLTATGLRSATTGGWVNGGNFTVGTTGTTPNSNLWPAAQSPDKAVDGILISKYLLFKTTNAALGLSPVAPSVYNTLTLTTAEDAPERDPTSYQVYGAATALPGTAGTAVPISGLTLLGSGSLSLPPARNDSSTVVSFTNTTAYASYLLVFPSVKNTPTTANSTQLSEVALSFVADTTGPAGGTMALAPASPVNAGAALTVTFDSWTDPSSPLTYTVLVDDVVVSLAAATLTRNFAAPTAPGVHVLKGRITDALGNATELTRNFTVNTAIESWRVQYFGSPANSGNGANSSDFDHDDLVNLAEFAFGLDPTVASNALPPQVQLSGGNLFFNFATPPGVSGITYGAESNTNLTDPWQPVTDSGTGNQHLFSVPIGNQPTLFLRLTVTEP